MDKTVLPRGWKSVRLGDIAIPIYDKVGNRILETLSITAGTGFANQAEKFGRELSGNQYVNYTVLRKGDFSFNKGNSKRYPYGCMYLLKDRDIAAVPNAFFSFHIEDQCSEFFEQLFLNGYLNYQLNKVINTGVRNDGLFNLYEADFYNCFIPLPPLPEQHAIAEILTTADKLIAIKERLIIAKQKQKQWLMQNLLTGKIRLPGFSGKWKKEALQDCGSIITGSTPSTTEQDNFGNDFLWVTPTDIDDSVYIHNTERKLSKKGMAKCRLINAGSVLVTCIASIGKNVILPEDGSCNQQINAITPNRKYSVEYLYYLISFNESKLKKYAGKTATPIINKETFQNMIFRFPSFPEQQAIAAVLSTADREIELLKKELEQQKLFKKYLMRQLLTGKIRVKNPDAVWKIETRLKKS